jgi:glycosyltransferase involved in cell wall biosynthesis
MAKKRILVYTENYLPSIGGLENNTLLACEALVALGCEVTLITPQEKAKQHQQFAVIESRSFLLYYGQIKKHDLVLINGGVAFKIIIPTLLRLKPFMIIYQMATLFNDIRNNNLKTRFLNKLRFAFAKLAKANIGVSEFSFLELQSIFGKKKTKLLINPADLEFNIQSINNTIPMQPFKCLFAGRLIAGKGVRLLIEAITEINKVKENIHLHFVGDGPEKDYVIKQDDKNFIYYHPPVSKKELKTFFKQMHLTIVPSTTHVEGSPLIMAESLMMGVPVLVSSQPAMAASINQKSLIFDSGKVDKLIEKLNYLMVEENYLLTKAYCKEISIHYSYPNYLKNLKSILDV